MAQLEYKGIILIDSKLEKILLKKNADDDFCFPTKNHHFETITSQFTKESGIKIDSINISTENNDDNVKYFLGILSSTITDCELTEFFSENNVYTNLEWIHYKEFGKLSNEMKYIVENAYKVFKNVPKEERSQMRDWKQNLLQFEDL
jgi:hypothetical protein